MSIQRRADDYLVFDASAFAATRFGETGLLTPFWRRRL